MGLKRIVLCLLICWLCVGRFVVLTLGLSALWGWSFCSAEPFVVATSYSHNYYALPSALFLPVHPALCPHAADLAHQPLTWPNPGPCVTHYTP